MAPAGPACLFNWFRGSYFISTYKVNANFRYSRLYFLIGECLRQPHVPADCVYTTANLLSLRRKKNHSIPARRYPR
jgi:hypothetical protein